MRAVVLLAMVMVGLLLCLDVAHYFHGSPETFLADDREEEVRVVTAALGAALFASELALRLAFRQLKQGATTRTPLRDETPAEPPAA